MIKIEGLSHKYRNRKEEAIKDINLHIKKGENVVIIGSSGCGKSTLLRSINRLIEPVSGEIFIDKEEILNCPIKKAINIRGGIGMIFQNFNLVEKESILKNVLNGRLRHNHPLKTLFGKFSEEDYKITLENIRKVGLSEYTEERICDLSGGQKQRVAIARALSQKPEIILADEPVSNLDPNLMKEVMDLLHTICIKENITLITSLHFLELAKKYATRIIGMKEGRIVFDGKPEELDENKIIEIYGTTGF